MQEELLENSLRCHAFISASDFIYLRHNVVPPKSHTLDKGRRHFITFTFRKAHEGPHPQPQLQSKAPARDGGRPNVFGC